MQSIKNGYGVDVKYMGRITDRRYSLDLPRETKLRVILKKLQAQGLVYFIEENTIIII